jgi:hypothetical protein
VNVETSIALTDEQQFAANEAEEIRGLLKRAARDIVVIGQKLIAVKARLGHGQWGAWLRDEFDWDERTARRFMSVGERFKTDNLSDLDIAPSALYLLAAPSTPENVGNDILARARAGEKITHRDALEAVRQAKELLNVAKQVEGSEWPEWVTPEERESLTYVAANHPEDFDAMCAARISELSKAIEPQEETGPAAWLKSVPASLRSDPELLNSLIWRGYVRGEIAHADLKTVGETYLDKKRVRELMNASEVFEHLIQNERGLTGPPLTADELLIAGEFDPDNKIRGAVWLRQNCCCFCYAVLEEACAYPRGGNPYPFSDYGRCCDACDEKVTRGRMCIIKAVTDDVFYNDLRDAITNGSGEMVTTIQVYDIATKTRNGEPGAGSCGRCRGLPAAPWRSPARTR